MIISENRLRLLIRTLLSEGKGPARETLDWCRENGIKVELSKGGHYRVFIPGGKIVVTASTPSDHRGQLNFRAEIRREIRKLIEQGKWPEENVP